MKKTVEDFKRDLDIANKLAVITRRFAQDVEIAAQTAWDAYDLADNNADVAWAAYSKSLEDAK